MFKYFIFLILIQLSFIIKAQPIIHLNDKGGEENFQSKVYIFRDAAPNTSIQDILAGKFDKNFKALNQKVPIFSCSNNIFWLKLKVKNTSQTKWVLEIDNPMLEEVTFYPKSIYGDNDNANKKNIAAIAFYERGNLSNAYLFPLLYAISVDTYYLRIRSTTTMQLPLCIIRNEDLSKKNHHKDLLNGIFLGFMLLMVVYNFFIYLIVKERTYLYYVLNTASVGLLSAVIKGFAFEFSWSNHPIIYEFARVMSALVSITSILFVVEFLHTKQIVPNVHRGLQLILMSCVLSIVLSLTGSALASSNLNQINGIITSLYLVFVGYKVYNHGHKEARFYIIASSFYSLGMLISILKLINFLPYNIFTNNALQFGSAIEALLLSVCLANRITRLKMEKKIAQEISIKSLKEREKLIKEQNSLVEWKVKERTKALEVNNIELNRIIDKVKNQTKIIEQRNKDITDSIQYARRIQSALLPLSDKITHSLKESFVYYQPKDIVSGDFYWISEKEDKILIAAVDCTGHGVPGAFMSMIGTNMLNDIVNRRNITAPHHILEELDKGIITILQQDENKNPDGMDIALCMIDKTNKTLQYAGAKNPLIIFQDGEMRKVQAGKSSIGGFQPESKTAFVSHIFDLKKPTIFYLFTDGYRDQFGGNKGGRGSKFLMKRFKELLNDIYHKPMNEQRLIIEEAMHNWKMGQEQTDDILVIGVNCHSFSF